MCGVWGVGCWVWHGHDGSGTILITLLPTPVRAGLPIFRVFYQNTYKPVPTLVRAGLPRFLVFAQNTHKPAPRPQFWTRNVEFYLFD
jgi:hypothetical protein